MGSAVIFMLRFVWMIVVAKGEARGFTQQNGEGVVRVARGVGLPYRLDSQ